MSGSVLRVASFPAVENDKRRVLVSPLKLDLLNSARDNREVGQNVRTASQSFCEVSHRGVSSMESLEYQDKYVTPVNCSDDNESDVERARIVEEAALVAEKLMSSQLSKITYESELRTMETRFPTRVNSPRYYNEKKEVMDRANRMLMGGGRRDCSVPRFLQSKLGWFNCVENFFSVCSDEQVVEENGADNSIETSPYFSPKRRVSPGKSVKILEGLKAFSGKEDRGDNHHPGTDLGQSPERKRSPGQAGDEKTPKPLATKRPVDSKKSTLGRDEAKSSRAKAKATTAAKLASSRALEKRSYDIENDVFYLDDGAGYITFNASRLDLSEMDNKPKPRRGNPEKQPSGPSPGSRNSDIENQKVSTSSLINVMGTEPTKKSPSRYSKASRQTEEGGGVQTEASSGSPKKECKKKLRALRQEAVCSVALDGTHNAEDSLADTGRNVLNYSSNCIRGRMDYISTDVFV